MPIHFYPDPDEDVPFTYLRPISYMGTLPPPYPAVEDTSMFLNFALEDRKQEDNRGLVNAFGNVKKALHLRIDMLLHQFGLFHHHRKANFPTKLKLLGAVGVIPTQLLANINKKRNDLEHEYVVPDLDIVDTALDFTQLLYLASDNVIRRTIREAVIGISRGPGQAILEVSPQRGELRFFELAPESDIRTVSENPHGNVETISYIPREILKKEPESPFEVITLTIDQEKQWAPIIEFLGSKWPYDW